MFAAQSRLTAGFAISSDVVSKDAAVPAAAPRHARRRTALDRRIDKILSSSDARRGSWGIEVVELESGKLLYERDAERLFIPASNMKMFTTAAGLEKPQLNE